MLMKQFKKELSTGIPTAIIPTELIEYFNQELPDGLKYAPMGDNLLHVDPQKMQMTCYVLEKENEKWFSQYQKYISSPNDIIDLMTITQTPLLIGVSDEVECDGIKIPTELLVRNAYDDKNIHQELVRYIMPLEIPSKKCIISDLDGNTVINTFLKMQKSEDVEHLTYNNFSDNTALMISFTVPSKYYSGEIVPEIGISVSVDKEKAKSVDDAINAYKLYDTFLKNEMCLNGSKITLNVPDSERIDECTKEINMNLKILKALKGLEEKLNVKFILSEKLDEEMIEIILKLYVSLLENKAFVEKTKLENVTFTRTLDKDELERTNELINKPSAFLTTGALTVNLLGNTIDMYYATCYFFVKISKLEKTQNNDYKLFFDSCSEQYHTSSKIYLDKETMSVETSNGFNNYFEDAIELKTIEETIIE